MLTVTDLRQKIEADLCSKDASNIDALTQAWYQLCPTTPDAYRPIIDDRLALLAQYKKLKP